MLALGAVTRAGIAGYVQAVIEVYIVLILIYLVLNMAFSLGVRRPYSRVLDGVMQFLRDVCEPYLRLFRRFIPQIGMLDLSPLAAIIFLIIVAWIVSAVIGG
jgi:YggT family protein